MNSKRHRLDRFISKKTCSSVKDVQRMLARGEIIVDGELAQSISQTVDEFSVVSLNGKILQAKEAIYLMLNKPQGVVSATKDDKHNTVIDLIEHPQKEELHIVGRLDYNSTGLLLLTNNGRWSKRISSPDTKSPKTYHVGLENPLTDDYIDAFAKSMYFAFEDHHTLPAQLRILNSHLAEVTLMEGKYHQIKRMFGRFQNPVISLHRISVGLIELDPRLQPGESRELREDEVNIERVHS